MAAMVAMPIAGDLLLSLWVQRWSSFRIVVLPIYGCCVSNDLFLFWLSTFPKWELEKRKKLAYRFNIITTCIFGLLMFIAFFLKIAHLK